MRTSCGAQSPPPTGRKSTVRVRTIADNAVTSSGIVVVRGTTTCNVTVLESRTSPSSVPRRSRARSARELPAEPSPRQAASPARRALSGSHPSRVALARPRRLRAHWSDGSRQRRRPRAVEMHRPRVAGDVGVAGVPHCAMADRPRVLRRPCRHAPGEPAPDRQSRCVLREMRSSRSRFGRASGIAARSSDDNPSSALPTSGRTPRQSGKRLPDRSGGSSTKCRDRSKPRAIHIPCSGDRVVSVGHDPGFRPNKNTHKQKKTTDSIGAQIARAPRRPAGSPQSCETPSMGTMKCASAVSDRRGDRSKSQSASQPRAAVRSRSERGHGRRRLGSMQHARPQGRRRAR
jgi:hypothetical protein